MTATSLVPAPQPSPLSPPAPRLLDQLRLFARQRGHCEENVAAFAGWARRLILFHAKRHPRDLGLPEVARKGPAGVASPLDLLDEVTPATVAAFAAASLELQGNGRGGQPYGRPAVKAMSCVGV